MSQAVSRATTAPDIRPQKNIPAEGLSAFRALRLVTRRNTNVKLVEPPSCSSASTIVLIGRNSRGNWVAQEQNGLYGGVVCQHAPSLQKTPFAKRHPSA